MVGYTIVIRGSDEEMRTPYKERIILSETDFIEIDIKETPEGIKFGLVLIRNNKRLVGFDNHEKHKPHKHVKNKVYDYNFVGVDRLIEDFYKEIERWLE